MPLSYRCLIFAMTFRSIPKRQYHLAFLATCIAVSTYGITVGRPVLQTGALRFPYAETLPFPYPLTTTLFQLIWTHACLLLGGSFACSINKSLDDLEARENNHPSNVKNALSALNWSTILRILPLPVTIAAEAALGNYILYNMPFEVYLLSRALVLPFLLLLDRFIYAKVSAGRLMYPSIVLAISVFITAFKLRLPHSGWTFLVVISSSILSALWPLQVQIHTRSAEPLSKGEYITVGSAETVSKKGNMETYTIWQLLYYTSLLSAIILIPVVLYSGEPGHILRNCYFLNEFRFWLYMAAGGMFRLTFFTSTILLIEKTSALIVTFFCVLVNITQITFFTFEKLRRLQLLGLTGSLLSSLWLLIASFDFNSTWGTIWENNRLAFRRRFYSVVLLIAIVIGFGTILQIWHDEGIVDTSPPLDRDDTGDFPASLFTSMVQGTDSYLGHRPPTNSVMNLQLLMEECEGTDNPITRDVFRCLEFLSTKRDLYLISPSEPSQDLSGDGESTVTDPVDPSANMCDGPIIPYHIWWSGLPTWRVELFIKAYLHTQNLPCSRLWIWVHGRAGENTVGMWFVDQRFRRFMPLIETGDIVVKQWMLPSRIPLPPRDSIDELDKARYHRNPTQTDSKGVRLVADSVLQDATGQEWLQFYDENQIIYYEKALSNVARFLIIHMHGGIYLDPGTILLRDIRPLLLSNISFIEKPDPREPFGNAIIALPANSSISSYILRGGTRMGLFFHAAVLQRMFVKEGRDGNNYNGGLVRLEDAIFDPIWAESHGSREGRCTVPCLNSYVSVFKAAPVQNEWSSFDGERLGGAAYNRTMENFYKGAFAYHIHGQKKTQYERGSWMDVICSAHDRWLAGMQLNPYGEKWHGPPITSYRHNS